MMRKCIRVQAPSGVSKFDPLPHALRVEAPAGHSQSDPFARIVDFFHARTSAKVRIEGVILWAQDETSGQVPCDAIARGIA